MLLVITILARLGLERVTENKLDAFVAVVWIAWLQHAEPIHDVSPGGTHRNPRVNFFLP